MPNPFRRQPVTEISKSPETNGKPAPPVRAAKATKVGLKPKADWHKRNFITEVFIPSIFTRRAGQRLTPEWPELKDGEIGITWIGHASFLIQAGGENLLIDPNWANWLKVIKRMRHPGRGPAPPAEHRPRARDPRALRSPRPQAPCAKSPPISRSSSRSMSEISCTISAFAPCTSCTTGKPSSTARSASPSRRAITGARACCTIRIAALAASSSRPAGAPSFTAAIPRTSMASARSAGAIPSTWRCCPSARTIRPAAARCT